jgi:4-carboxymuconolactone decarboxylase
MMTAGEGEPFIDRLEERTHALIRLAAAVAGGDELTLRRLLAAAVGKVPPVWVEELILQSHLFAGFPRTINAMREWRRVSGVPAPAHDDDVESETLATWELRGEVTCASVYGSMYDDLRHNIRTLHPALDRLMIVEGYGMMLGRPGLDLLRRELCVVAACVATFQERQLVSHLHGALNVGASRGLLSESLDALDGLVSANALRTARLLLDRVAGKE